MNMRDWVLICWSVWGIGAFVVSPALALTLHARLIRRLKEQHYVLWLDLGAPTVAKVPMTGGIPFGGVNVRLGFTGNKYLDWLSTQGSGDIHDAEVASSGEKLRRFGWIGPLVLLAVAAVLVIAVRSVKLI
jgi:hypothetical protein